MDWAGLGLRTQTAVFKAIVVTAPTAAKVIVISVNGSAGINARAGRDLTAVAGDIVLCTRLGNEVVAYARLYQAAPAAPPAEDTNPPPPVQPVVVTGSTNIAPVETRSYRANFGWRTDNDDVYQGEYGNNGNHTGCAFYGNGPRQLAGATVTSASIRASRTSGGDFAARATTLYRITNKTKPGGAPTRTGSSTGGPNLAVDKSDSTISIPTSFAQDLVDGTAGGLAIYQSDGSPYVRLKGRGSYGSSFVLTIKWKRDS